MKELLATVATLFCSAMMTAQNVSQFKVIDDSLFQNDDVYVKGNKYQRDAMLFVDLLADTHPYYGMLCDELLIRLCPVIFIHGEKTFSSAGILMTLARDNNIGVIVGTEA